MRQPTQIKPTVEGIGINDADYSVVKEKCPFYARWQAMLTRCYSKNSLKKRAGYQGCTVVPEWHLFSNFKNWMLKQDWENKVLDKDILVPGNKVYGPNTCIFISQTLNSLLNPQSRKRGALPIGVNKTGNKKPYKALLKIQTKTSHLGVFDTVEEAAKAYSNAKADWIIQHAMAVPQPQVRNALLHAADNCRRGIQ